jgi:hypothetical protein
VVGPLQCLNQARTCIRQTLYAIQTGHSQIYPVVLAVLGQSQLDKYFFLAIKRSLAAVHIPVKSQIRKAKESHMKTQRYVLSLLALTLACFAGIAIRPLFSGSVKAASADPISVLCTACTLGPNNIAPLYLVIRDETTGQVWAYPRYTSIGNSLEPGAKPILVGPLVPGQPL